MIIRLLIIIITAFVSIARSQYASGYEQTSYVESEEEEQTNTEEQPKIERIDYHNLHGVGPLVGPDPRFPYYNIAGPMQYNARWPYFASPLYHPPHDQQFSPINIPTHKKCGPLPPPPPFLPPMFPPNFPNPSFLNQRHIQYPNFRPPVIVPGNIPLGDNDSTPDSSSSKPHSVYRAWSAANRDHFYTTVKAEIVPPYKFETIEFKLFIHSAPELVPVYRYFQPEKRDHFYTTNVSEIGDIKIGAAGRYGYIRENNLGYIATKEAPGLIPVYRYYRPDVVDHFYTTRKEEIGESVELGKPGKYGYIYEGILGWAFPGKIAKN